MVVIEMQDTKAGRQQRVWSLINSGGRASMKMLIKQFKVVDDVNSMGEVRRKLS